MKKTLLAILAVTALVAILSSCTGKGDPGAAGVAGPTGTDGYLVMEFQNGVMPSSAYAGATDVRIVSDPFEDNNYNAAASMQLGLQVPHYKRGIFKFLTNAYLGSGVKVKKAYLTLYCSSVVTATPAFYLLPISGSWIESEATWISATAAAMWSTAGGTTQTAAVSNNVTVNTASKYYSFEITPSFVQSWIDTPAGNFGVLVRAVDESSSANEAIFATDNSATPAMRPKLTIYYTLE